MADSSILGMTFALKRDRETWKNTILLNQILHSTTGGVGSHCVSSFSELKNKGGLAT